MASVGPALILVLLIFAKLYITVRIFSVGGGRRAASLVVFVTPHCVVVVHCSQPGPTVGISFGKNTSIFSLNFS